MSDAIARLTRWRDVGDGPIKYCAGDKEFADDVIAALATIDRITAERDGLLSEVECLNSNARVQAKLLADTGRERDGYKDEAAGWRISYNVASSERDGLKAFADWVETWVSNPVGSYSVHALDGLFGMTRDKLAALRTSSLSDADRA